MSFQKIKLQQNITLLSWFNSLINFRLYNVIAILYFAEVTKSYALALSIFSIMQIAQAVFEVPTGFYSDKIGRKKSLVLGTVVSCLTVLFYAIGQSYWILAIGAVLQGLYSALFSGNNNALLYESLAELNQKEKFDEVLGKIHSNLELVGFFAAALGGLVAFYSYSWLLWLSMIPQILALIVAFRVTEPTSLHKEVGNIYAHLAEAVTAFRKNAKLRNLSLAGIIGVGVGDSAWSFQSAFYKSVLPVWAVGFVMSLNFLISAVSFRLSGRIIRRFKALNILIYQEVYSRVLYAIALIFPTGASPFIMAAASVLYGPGFVALNALQQSEFTDKQRATMASLNSLVGSCFYAVFAVLIGVVADKLGPASAMMFAQICLIPVLFMYLNVFSKQKIR